MHKLLIGIMALVSFSAFAVENNSLIYRTEIEGSIENRIAAYRESTIVAENISKLEEQLGVKCLTGEVTLGEIDNPLINRNIYSTNCLSANAPLKVRIISKFKILKNLATGKDLIEFKLKQIKVQ